MNDRLSTLSVYLIFKFLGAGAYSDVNANFKVGRLFGLGAYLDRVRLIG